MITSLGKGETTHELVPSVYAQPHSKTLGSDSGYGNYAQPGRYVTFYKYFIDILLLRELGRT